MMGAYKPWMPQWWPHPRRWAWCSSWCPWWKRRGRPCRPCRPGSSPWCPASLQLHKGHKMKDRGGGLLHRSYKSEGPSIKYVHTVLGKMNNCTFMYSCIIMKLLIDLCFYSRYFFSKHKYNIYSMYNWTYKHEQCALYTMYNILCIQSATYCTYLSMCITIL